MSEDPGEEATLPNMQEQNLCTWYGDHDECPYTEIDENGHITVCQCSCHLDPEAIP